MMTAQARERFTPRMHPHHPLRTYAPDSPRAMARLVALAMLADGRLEDRELAALDRRGVLSAIGITRADFYQVLCDLCQDLAALPDRRGAYFLSAQVLDGLFSEVRSTARRKSVVRTLFDVIRSDGHLAAGEQRLFWSALDAWRMRMEDMSVPPSACHGGMTRPEHYYG